MLAASENQRPLEEALEEREVAVEDLGEDEVGDEAAAKPAAPPPKTAPKHCSCCGASLRGTIGRNWSRCSPCEFHETDEDRKHCRLRMAKELAKKSSIF